MAGKRNSVIMSVAIDGPCKGHPCDRCKTCQGSVPKRITKGSPGREPRCCRRDNPGYQLPNVGEWDAPIYGLIGRLVRDRKSVECHVCGEQFKRMHTHVWQAHNLTAREYKAIFGLKLTESLDCEENREKNRDGHPFLLDPDDPRYQAAASVREQNAFTPERAQYVQSMQRVSLQERWERRQKGTLMGVEARKDRWCEVCGTKLPWKPPNQRRTCSAPCQKTLNYRNHGRPRAYTPVVISE